MDGTGGAHRSHNLFAHANYGSNGGNARLRLFDRRGPAPLLRFVQSRGEGLLRRNGPRSADVGTPETTGNGARARASPLSSVASHAFPFAVI